MPRELKTNADPDALVPVTALVPGWMKNGVSEHLKAQGKTLTDWLRDEMRKLIADAESTHGPRRKKK